MFDYCTRCGHNFVIYCPNCNPEENNSEEKISKLENENIRILNQLDKIISDIDHTSYFFMRGTKEYQAFAKNLKMISDDLKNVVNQKHDINKPKLEFEPARSIMLNKVSENINGIPILDLMNYMEERKTSDRIARDTLYNLLNDGLIYVTADRYIKLVVNN